MKTKWCILVLLLVVPLTGCLVAPVPVRKQTASAKGKIDNFDLAKVQPGAKRDQIEKQLADIMIDCGTPRLFWGRWSSSSWALIYGQVADGHGSGGGTRIGKLHNLVLEFDESGKLLRRHDVSENSLLPALETSLRDAAMPPLALDAPVVLNARHWKHLQDPAEAGRLILTRTEFNFEEQSGKHSFSIAASAVKSLSSGLQSETAAELIAVTVHLSDRTAAGKSVKLGMTPTELLTLIRWVQQVKGN